MSTTSASGHGVWLYACGIHVKLQCRCMENHGSPTTTDTLCPTCSARALGGGPAELEELVRESRLRHELLGTPDPPRVSWGIKRRSSRWEARP